MPPVVFPFGRWDDALMGLVGAMGRLHGRAVFPRRIRVLASELATLLLPGPLADVGCGTGDLAAAVKQLRPDLEPTGFDVLVRSRAAIPVRAFDGRRIPLEDGAVASALLADVLHHVESPGELLRECARVARTVVVKDHLSRGAFDDAVLRFMDWVGNRPHGVVLRYRYFRRETWARAVDDSNLVITTWSDVPGLYPLPWSLLFGRKMHFVARLDRRP